MSKSVKSSKDKTTEYVVRALETKKEIKTRVSKGESFSKVVQEKGFKIVFPI